jgi:excisionase family DNA binding protein
MVTAPRERLLTAREVATELNLHIYTVYDLLKEGRIAAIKINSHWRIKRDELDKFVKKG